MSLHIVAALGYVIYGALIYGALIAWAAYSRDWFWLRHLMFGTVCAWGSYLALLVTSLIPNGYLYREDKDGVIRGGPQSAPWWAKHVEVGQRALASVSILIPAIYIIALLVRR